MCTEVTYYIELDNPPAFTQLSLGSLLTLWNPLNSSTPTSNLLPKTDDTDVTINIK